MKNTISDSVKNTGMIAIVILLLGGSWIYWSQIRPIRTVSKCETESITRAQDAFANTPGWWNEEAGAEWERARAERINMKLVEVINEGFYKQDDKINMYYACLREHGVTND